MPLSSTALGSCTSPRIMDITPRQTIAYAAGLGDTSPCYFLPDIILPGTATWALAASKLIQHCAGGDPTRLLRFAGRFTAMVIPGTIMTLEYATAHQDADVVPFIVRNATGESAISHGQAVFAA